MQNYYWVCGAKWKDFLNKGKNSIANTWTPNPSLVASKRQMFYPAAGKTPLKVQFKKDVMEFYHKRIFIIFMSTTRPVAMLILFSLKILSKWNPSRSSHTIVRNDEIQTPPWTNVVFNFGN